MIRRGLAVALLFLGLGPCARRATGQQVVPSTTVDGIFEQVVEDHFDKETATQTYLLKTPSGYVTLSFPDPQMTQNIRSGSKVRVTGRLQGSELAIDLLPAARQAVPLPKLKANIAILEPSAALAASGIRKVAVLLVTFTNDQTQPISPAEAKQVLATIGQYYRENSYGRLTVTGDVFGYLRLPMDDGCPNGYFDTITTSAAATAENAGINLSSYQSYVVIGATSSASCANQSDLATIGGSPGKILLRLAPAQATLSIETTVLTHELGHNLGVFHSQSIDCGTIVYNPNLSCSVQEYGDNFDVMGDGRLPAPNHFNAVFKTYLGWLSPATVTTTGIYNLAPYEVASASLPMALKIPANLPAADPLGQNTFYLEYRQPIGFDDGFGLDWSAQDYSGASFHIGPTPDIHNQILNMNPATLGPNENVIAPALIPGQQYVDYAKRFSVTTLSTSPASVQLRILVPGVNTPTLLFTQPAGGGTLTGMATVSIDALDRTGITKVELLKDAALLATLTSPPYQFSWDTSKEIAGNHILTGKAFNAAGHTYSQSIIVATNTSVPPLAPQPAAIAQATGVPGATRMSPGSLVTIYGSQLAEGTAPASTVPLPFSLSDVSVMFNGRPAPLLFVNANQINTQVPWDVLPPGGTLGTATLVVTSLGVPSSPRTVPIGPFSQGIFTLQYGTGQAVASNLDGTLAAATGSIPGLTTHPASVGDIIVILASGLGAVTPSIADGASASDGLRNTLATPTVLVGGIPAKVKFSGLSPQFVGVNQLNVVVPQGVPTGDAVPLQIRLGGITTSDEVTIALQ